MNNKIVQVVVRCVNQMMPGVRKAVKEMNTMKKAGAMLKKMPVSLKATESISAVKKQLQGLVRTVKRKIPVNLHVATNISAVKKQFKQLSKPFKKKLRIDVSEKPAAKVAEQMGRIRDAAGSAGNSIRSLASAMGLLYVAGKAVQGVGSMLAMGSDLEQQQISVKHFIGVSNAGMDKRTVDAVSAQYLKDLRKNAELTPFSSTEVVAAGTRAVQIADGDTKKAMEFVKLAEDMAALNPGKTISDAMEALADANVGEMERLKEFGFKISADDFKAAGGDMLAMKDAKGRTLKGVYDGGAAKLAGSSKGMLNTITGSLQSGMQDAGFAILQSLAPTLRALIPVAQNIGPVFASWGTSIAKVINRFTEGGGALEFFRNIAAQLRPVFDQVSTWAAVNLPVIWQGFLQIAAAVEPIISTVITLIGIFWQLFNTAWPLINDIASVIKDVLVVALESVNVFLTAMGKTFSWLGGIAIPILEGIWAILKPIVEGLKWASKKGVNILGDVVGSNTKVLPNGNGNTNNSTVNQTNNVTVNSPEDASLFVVDALPDKYILARG